MGAGAAAVGAAGVDVTAAVGVEVDAAVGVEVDAAVGVEVAGAVGGVPGGEVRVTPTTTGSWSEARKGPALHRVHRLQRTRNVKCGGRRVPSNRADRMPAAGLVVLEPCRTGWGVASRPKQRLWP